MPALKTISQHDYKTHQPAVFTQALENREFELHYQPQVHLHSGAVVGIEALLRWRHPWMGLLYPASFIAELEESPISVPIGAMVIDMALRDAARLFGDGEGSPPRVAINLSPGQLNVHNLPALILETAAGYDLSPGQIEIEITERVALRGDEGHIGGALRQLREAGCLISLDDFGTGYGSMSSIVNFPVNKLKIDRQFVSRIGICKRHEAVIRAILRLAALLEMSVVAEGIEEVAQVESLRNFGCLEGQGYLFARPMPFDELQIWLKQKRSSIGRPTS